LPVGAVAVLLAVLLGLFAPLLGGSLLAFLVIDAVLGRLHARRSRNVQSVNRT
jgi:hypothetical protein